MTGPAAGDGSGSTESDRTARRPGRRNPRSSDTVLLTSSRGPYDSLGLRVRTALPLLWLWIGRDLRTRYRHSWLRAGWIVIQPIVLLLTYGWVLTAVLDVGDEQVPYLTFAWAGLVVFIFLQQSLSAGVGSIQQSRHIITKVYFPREVLPLAAVGAAFVDLLIMTAILVVLAWIQVGPPTIHLSALVVVYAVVLLWAGAFTVFASTAAVFRRDVMHVMPLFLRVLFILSPVMYATALLEEHAPAFVSWNPVTVGIESTRDAATRGRWPNWTLLGAHGAIGLTLFLISLLVIKRFERRMSDAA